MTATTCDKAFVQISHLIHHLRIHSEENSYECNECGKAFSWKSHLVGHQKIHNGKNLCK